MLLLMRYCCLAVIAAIVLLLPCCYRHVTACNSIELFCNYILSQCCFTFLITLYCRLYALVYRMSLHVVCVAVTATVYTRTHSVLCCHSYFMSFHSCHCVLHSVLHSVVLPHAIELLLMVQLPPL